MLLSNLRIASSLYRQARIPGAECYAACIVPDAAGVYALAVALAQNADTVTLADRGSRSPYMQQTLPCFILVFEPFGSACLELVYPCEMLVVGLERRQLTWPWDCQSVSHPRSA
jgi:hypothetical protein